MFGPFGAEQRSARLLSFALLRLWRATRSQAVSSGNAAGLTLGRAFCSLVSIPSRVLYDGGAAHVRLPCRRGACNVRCRTEVYSRFMYTPTADAASACAAGHLRCFSFVFFFCFLFFLRLYLSFRYTSGHGGDVSHVLQRVVCRAGTSSPEGAVWTPKSSHKDCFCVFAVLCFL